MNVSSSPVPSWVWAVGAAFLAFFLFGGVAGRRFDFSDSHRVALELRDHIRKHPLDKSGIENQATKLGIAIRKDWEKNGLDYGQKADALVEFELNFILNFMSIEGMKNDARTINQIAQIDACIGIYLGWKITIGQLLGAAASAGAALTDAYRMPYRTWRRYMRSLGFENSLGRPARRYARASYLASHGSISPGVESSYVTVPGQAGPRVHIPDYTLKDFVNKIAAAFSGRW